MVYYLAEDTEALEHEKILAKLRKNLVILGTEKINWEKAKHGWTQYYDDGIVTLDPKVFFNERRKKNERK